MRVRVHGALGLGGHPVPRRLGGAPVGVRACAAGAPRQLSSCSGRARRSSCPCSTAACFPRPASALTSSCWKGVQTPARCLGVQRGARLVAAARPEGNDVQREFLLRYVSEVQPTVLESFSKSAPPVVVEAMRKTVNNMIGTLPPEYFEVRVTAAGDNLMQLMYSIMMTGYMLRNAQYQVELQNSALGLAPIETAQKAIPEQAQQLHPDDCAPGIESAWIQKKGISGHVTRWEYEKGEVAVPAADYIEALEAELAVLRGELAAMKSVNSSSSSHENRLLSYLQGLDPATLQGLTGGVTQDVTDAMNVFMARLLGTDDKDILRGTDNSTSAQDLARLLFWLMIVGYSLRTYEVRFDMERALNAPSSKPSLPAGLGDLFS